jgi:DNA polymerase III subunit beta
VPPKALEQVRRLFPPKRNSRSRAGTITSDSARRSPRCITRLIEGPYPNYEQVIPKDNDKHCLARQGCAHQCAQAHERHCERSDASHQAVVQCGHAEVRRHHPRPRRSGDELPINYDGDPLDIGFNAAYLLEILRYMPTDEVKLTFKAPERAATIEPHGWDGAADYLCLVMPLRLMD